MFLVCLAGCSLHQASVGLGTGEDRDPAEPGAEVELDGGSLDAQRALDAPAPFADAGEGAASGDAGPHGELDAQRDASGEPPEASDASADAVVEPIDSGVADSGVVDSGVVDSGVADSSVADAALDAGVSCALSGDYAALIDLAVTWSQPTLSGANAFLQPGSGHIYLLARVRLEAGNATAVFAPCGLRLPDFEGTPAAGGGLFGGDIPVAAWEAATMPVFNGTWSRSCDGAGCSIASQPLQVLIGARPRASAFVWPAPGNWTASGALDAVDDDGDGRAGLSWLLRGPDRSNPAGRPYAYLPAGAAEYGGARRLSFALSLRLSLSGALASCDAASGTLPLAAFNLSTVGCTGAANGSNQEIDCPPELVQVFDAYSLQYAVQAGSFQLQRTPSAYSCSAVRSAFGF